MKTFNFTRVLFLLTSLLILVGGFVLPENNLTVSIIGGLLIIALVILDIKAGKITNLSEDNPKVKTIRTLNRLIISIVVVACIFFILSPIESSVDINSNEILLLGVTSIFIMFFGNQSPKIPFNRYIGLRLPWTIRDEDTWKIAHKIVGYLSFPIALIMFISGFFFKVETVAVTGILTWVAIPSLYSLFFYYNKMSKLTKIN